MPDGRAATAAAEHLERPLDRLGDAGALEGDVGAQPAGHRPDGPDRVAGGGVDGLEAQRRRLGQALSAADHDDPPRPPDAGGVAGQQADRAGAGDDHRVAGGDVAAVGDVEGDRGRVDERAVLEREGIGQREDRLDALDDVRRVGTLDAVAVLLVEPGPAVVLAQVVATLDALATDAAGVVAGAGDPVADLPAEALRARARGRRSRRPTRAPG